MPRLFRPMGPGGPNDRSWAAQSLKRLFNPALLEQRKQNMVVTRFDPDLAANRSMSLSVKMLIQRERNFKRETESERTYLQQVLDGTWD
ncbi:MAG: hypothetical protein Q8P46_00265 [Hyphomicrobiales bacterium]|nr:hypothetical protein [Hyphomicrobiales bacterium]